MHRIRARAAVLATGGWVSRSIVADLPEAQTLAYGDFRYGPILTVNVALRNSRFFDRLGFTVARWFSGLGWHAFVRRNVFLGGHRQPLMPSRLIALTFHIPLLSPGADPALQGALGRARLLATSRALPSIAGNMPTSHPHPDSSSGATDGRLSTKR